MPGAVAGTPVGIRPSMGAIRPSRERSHSSVIAYIKLMVLEGWGSSQVIKTHFVTPVTPSRTVGRGALGDLQGTEDAVGARRGSR
jgi:hypothetical protein